MAEILSYNSYRDMHNDVQFSAMFFGKNIQNIPLFNSTQTAVKEFDSYGLKVFTFTGKERDSETGFSYFGARYYDSDLMTGWLSVDPMADKYPSLSPYAYCGWNPVKLVDPDGEEIAMNDDWYKDAKGHVHWDANVHSQADLKNGESVYTRRLNKKEIDEIIEDKAKDDWNIDRIAKMDLPILRVAIYEIRHREDIPVGVSIIAFAQTLSS